MKLPDGLTPAGSTRVFTEADMPAALQEEHSLRPGRWGLFRLLEGSAVFVDLETGEEESLVAPAERVIVPQALHKVRVEGPLRCQIDFHVEPSDR
jgi:hemoglobin